MPSSVGGTCSSDHDDVELDPDPGPDAFLCKMPGGYMQIAELLRRKYRVLRDKSGEWNFGPWHKSAAAARRNYLVALIKAGEYIRAEQLCTSYMEKAGNKKAGFSYIYWALYCIRGASIYLSGNDLRLKEADHHYEEMKGIREPFRDYGPVFWEFRALQWVAEKRQDYLVLRGDLSGLSNPASDFDLGLVRVTDLTQVPKGALSSVRDSGWLRSRESGLVTFIKTLRGVLKRRRRRPIGRYRPLTLEGLKKECNCAWTSEECLCEEKKKKREEEKEAEKGKEKERKGKEKEMEKEEEEESAISQVLEYYEEAKIPARAEPQLGQKDPELGLHLFKGHGNPSAGPSTNWSAQDGAPQPSYAANRHRPLPAIEEPQRRLYDEVNNDSTSQLGHDEKTAIMADIENWPVPSWRDSELGPTLFNQRNPNPNTGLQRIAPGKHRMLHRVIT